MCLMDKGAKMFAVNFYSQILVGGGVFNAESVGAFSTFFGVDWGNS
jgi:hypothetical protein